MVQSLLFAFIGFGLGFITATWIIELEPVDPLDSVSTIPLWIVENGLGHYWVTLNSDQKRKLREDFAKVTASGTVDIFIYFLKENINVQNSEKN